jgi:hypothetical protein
MLCCFCVAMKQLYQVLNIQGIRKTTPLEPEKVVITLQHLLLLPLVKVRLFSIS